MSATKRGRRLVTPAQARKMRDRAAMGRLAYLEPVVWHDLINLAHTAIVLGEQREAVLALHHDDNGDCSACGNWGGLSWSAVPYPCPTARALAGEQS